MFCLGENFKNRQKIVNFPKIPKNTSIETSINVLCRTRISNSLRILPLSVFTLERYKRLRCSHHFVTFCCNVSPFHMMSPFSVTILDAKLVCKVHYLMICWGWYCLYWDLTDQGHLKSFGVIWGQSGQNKRKWYLKSLKIQRV